MPHPEPTYIFRIVHRDNLPILMKRGGLHAPSCTPQNGLDYKTIHNIDIQDIRKGRAIPCGPGGVIHDYVSFYFGPRSPMLFQLHTGQVAGYNEGQEPLLYLVSTVQCMRDGGTGFVFSDGHGIAHFTRWFDDLAHLDEVDWEVVKAKFWKDTDEDNDRQRRKQAEFLVHRFCGWELIRGIAVINESMKSVIEGILRDFPKESARKVIIRPQWYY